MLYTCYFISIPKFDLEELRQLKAQSLKGNKIANQKSLVFVRYADDFVILHPELEVITQAQLIITNWLKEVGLELSDSKTKISHTLNPINDRRAGFDFLGFNIRQYPVGKHNSGSNTNGKTLGFKTIIKPSTAKIISHYRKIAEIIQQHNAAPQQALIKKLNPVINGWANYYSTVVSKEIYAILDDLIWHRIYRWCKFRHSNKPSNWIRKKYYKALENRNGVFSDGIFILANHTEIPG